MPRDGPGRVVLDTPAGHAFVLGVCAAIVGAVSSSEACEAIRPRFAALLADPQWLPVRYQEAVALAGKFRVHTPANKRHGVRLATCI